MVLSPHMQRIPYSTAFVPISGLSETLQCAMARLYLDSYDGSSESFHPHWGEPRGDLKALADALALELYPDDYNPATGVVEFSRSRGHLKAEIASLSRDELQREEVRFFVERNPGYQRGHELVCLC